MQAALYNIQAYIVNEQTYARVARDQSAQDSETSEEIYSCWISSSTFQSSNELSGASQLFQGEARSLHSPGRYRRMTSGIFCALSSFNAISSGSVSFSTGTSTGAFILAQAQQLLRIARGAQRTGVEPPLT